MKRSSSSPPIQLLAAAAEFRTMSSRPTYRCVRNQWPRGYSSRPTGGGYGGGDQFVSGDLHHQSVREANQGFQPRGRSNYGNQSGFRPSYNRTPPPAYYAPPPFTYPPPPNYAPPAFNQNQQFRPPQQFRPRPQKPMDHRNWEFVKPGPPPQCERFTVLSYNILADYLATNHRGKLYSHVPWRMLDWEWRTRSILFELGLWSADVLCFQEVDRFQDLEERLRVQGYTGIWKMRTGVAVDGCAIFWRASRFKLIYEEGVEFNKLGLRDNVAQICVLESLNQSSGNHNNMSEQTMSLPGVNRVVICNIHVLYNPKRGEIKLGQVRVLLSRAHAASKLWDDAPVVLCGDFNCTPKSPLYNYISEQKLDLSDFPRDEISGQTSAQMYQTRPFNPNFRGAGASSTAGPSVGASNKEVSCVNSVVGFKDDISSAINSVSGENSSSQINAGSDVSGTSSISRQEGKHLEKETHQAVDRNDVAKEDDTFPSMSDSNGSNSMDSIIKKRMENLSLFEFPEINVEDETTGKESSMFLSELHGKNSSFSSEVSVTVRPDFVESSSKSMEEPASPPMSQEDEVPGDNSGYINDTRFVYDPSAWTPGEICTATGDADCKYLDHPLKLRSTYTEIEDSQGTRDSNGEPQVTSYNRCFIGTVDYIWRSEGLETVKVLAPIPKHAMMWTPGYPTKKWGSDHIALVSELAFTKEEARYGLK